MHPYFTITSNREWSPLLIISRIISRNILQLLSWIKCTKFLLLFGIVWKTNLYSEIKFSSKVYVYKWNIMNMYCFVSSHIYDIVYYNTRTSNESLCTLFWRKGNYARFNSCLAFNYLFSWSNWLEFDKKNYVWHILTGTMYQYALHISGLGFMKADEYSI